MKRCVLLSFLLLSASFAQAQVARPDNIFGQFSAAGGFPSRETQVSGPLHHYTFSLETQYSEKTLPGFYGPSGLYPSLGMTFGLYHYDKARFPQGTPYSNHYSFSLHYEQPFWSSGRWSSFFMLEEGFGFTPNSYDALSNPESTYGGHFHVAFHMGAFISYDLSDRLRLSVGPSYAHHSNSKTNFVNTGADAISLEVALSYHVQPLKKSSERITVEEMGVRLHYLDVQYGACVTGAGTDDWSQTWRYISHKVSVAYLWRCRRRAAFGVGADAFFDKGGNENRNAFGICAAADYYVTRNLLISGRVGGYLNGKASNGSPIYETIGLNYCLDSSKWYIPYLGFATKANMGKAEHLEIVLGVRI